MQDSTLRQYAALAVPRYTSYPTAADFVKTIGPADFSNWLRQLHNEDAVSLYLHVPYCTEICYYCGCNAKKAIRTNVVADFVACLVEEIELAGKALTGRPKVVHLHWGGGTPSILNASQFSLVMDSLRRHFDFANDMEHAIELDPRTVTTELAALLKDMGVNRASLGVQDTDPSVQRAIGRIQPYETVERAVIALRNVGISRINFDLIYGLPMQTQETLKQTCETVLALKPDRVAYYGYAHLPQRRANQRLIDVSMLPDTEERFAQSETIAEFFNDHGYQQIGIDHFAVPDDALALAASKGQLKRNFQGYTDDGCKTLVGFGPSSISQFPEGFAANIADVPRYQACIREGNFATVRGHKMRDNDRLRAEIIEELMCNFEVDLNSFKSDQEFSDELALLRPLVVDDLIEIHGGRIAATEKGKPLIRLAAAAFDEFRKEQSSGFSFAV